jgi:hypothetical protein
MVSLIDALRDMMPDTVTMQSGTYDGRGKFFPTGDPVTIPAYCHGITGETNASDGRTVHGATVRVVLAGFYGATVRHQFTLPARFVPNVVRPLMVEDATDESGPHHQTLFF